METIVRRIGLVAHDAMKKDMIEWFSGTRNV